MRAGLALIAVFCLCATPVVALVEVISIVLPAAKPMSATRVLASAAALVVAPSMLAPAVSVVIEEFDLSCRA